MPLHMQNDPREATQDIPVTPAERAARVELAACYRIFDMLGWTELIFNHITLRVPGPQRVFLINPFGLHYSEVTASNLVAIDIDGRPVRAGQHPVNRAGFVVHSAIHARIDGAHCVMHTHTTAGSAVAGLESGLSHDSFYGAMLDGRVAYHDFEGVTVNPDEQQRLLHSIGDKKVVILRNHGLLAWGASIPEAFLWLWTLQRACEIQVSAAGAGPTRRLAPAVLAQAAREGGAVEPIVYDMVYAALKRKLDTVDEGYKA